MSAVAAPWDVLPAAVYWEDLVVGTRYATASRTITETDVVAFATLTGDLNRQHIDVEYSKTSMFGQRIAHGLLVVSIGSGLNTRTVAYQLMEPSLLGLVGTELTFQAPTFIGDTVHVDIEVTARRETRRSDRGVVTFRRSTVNQRGEIVVEAVVTMLMRCRPTGNEVIPTQAGAQP